MPLVVSVGIWVNISRLEALHCIGMLITMKPFIIVKLKASIFLMTFFPSLPQDPGEQICDTSLVLVDLLVLTVATQENDAFNQFLRSTKKYGLDVQVGLLLFLQSKFFRWCPRPPRNLDLRQYQRIFNNFITNKFQKQNEYYL